jgi:predicted outer membrane repeat protein
MSIEGRRVWVGLALGLLVSISAASAQAQQVLRVDADSPCLGVQCDGGSWETAYHNPQEALAAAGGTVTEIRVAQGYYMPDGGYGTFVNGDFVVTRGTGNRSASFQLLSSVTLNGGYRGYNTQALDPDVRPGGGTFLSGDLDGDEGPEIGPNDPPSGDDNSYHVVTASGTGSGAVLDGLSIVRGNADGGGSPCSPSFNALCSGAGLYNDGGSPTLYNCTFACNWASQNGGGMYNVGGSPVLMDNCVFTANHAGESGGGMCSVRGAAGQFCSVRGAAGQFSNPTLDTCTFDSNCAGYGFYGAGMYTDGFAWVEGEWTEGGTLTVRHCQFNNQDCTDAVWNQSIGDQSVFYNCSFYHNARGVVNDSCSPRFELCWFRNNHADGIGNMIYWGAGMLNQSGGAPYLLDCHFISNYADCPACGGLGTVAKGGAMALLGGAPVIEDCEFTGNWVAGGQGGAVYGEGSVPTFRWSSQTPQGFSDNHAFKTDNIEIADGGAVFLRGGHATFDNCPFSDNSAEGSGGALYGQYWGSWDEIDMTGCTLEHNTAGATGGAIDTEAIPLYVVRCTLQNNSVSGSESCSGGAVYANAYSSFVRCAFRSNSGGSGGGAVSGGGDFLNCLFSGNRADAGNAIYNTNQATLTNCTLGLDYPGTAIDSTGPLTLANSVIAGVAGRAAVSQTGDPPTVLHSCIQGGWPGQGEEDVGSITVSSGGEVFVLSPSPGPDGDWGTEDDIYGDLHLAFQSPCIDAGNNADVPPGVTVDLDAHARFVDAPCVNNDCRWAPGTCGTAPIVDMGAYEFEQETVSVVGWRSVRSHAGTPFSIVLGPPGPSVVSETRQGGIQRIEVDFDRPTCVVNLAGISVSDGTTPYTPTSIEMMGNGVTLAITFVDGLPNKKCYTITLDNAVAGLTGVAQCRVRGLWCDVDSDGGVTIADVLQTKNKQGSDLGPTTCKYDVDCNGGINIADVLLVKNRQPDSAPCP